MRVALFGQGVMGTRHARTLRSRGDVTDLRIYDADPGRRTHETPEQVLEGAGAAVIAAPAGTHAGLLELCAEHGVPVFCEKPIATDLEEAIRVVEVLRGHDAVTQIGFQRRFDDGFRAAREDLRSGRLGTPRSFTIATFDRTPPPPAYVAGSGGIFRDMHVHDFDTVRWLFGEEIEEVWAAGSALGDPVFAENDDIDVSGVVVRLAGGAVGAIAGSRQNPDGYLARLEVYGDQASHVLPQPRSYRDFLDRYDEAYGRELACFIEVASGKRPSPCTVFDGLESLRVAVAAERARRGGAGVRVAAVPGLGAG
ncbi:MAG TPA: Gfo/Idh/MocA family oxidoreductase [Candidatus Dormibacteraeota bacterium]|jgi:myo-inositol 2-dehydrogenase/D-chiro-inositol 1-dehydrogenase|nr:Gfo/Idh/MocA family oxidoreductase [Candidatus Dormibacteraeota bacterium]